MLVCVCVNVHMFRTIRNDFGWNVARKFMINIFQKMCYARNSNQFESSSANTRTQAPANIQHYLLKVMKLMIVRDALA